MALPRVFASILALILLVSSLTLPAHAEDYEQPVTEAEEYILGSGSESGDLAVLDPYAILTMSLDTDTEELAIDGLPATYDPRTEATQNLTPVRNQGSLNTCWAVAAMGAAEINALAQGILTGADTLNLSEWQMIYFMATQVDDPLGNDSGDYNTTLSRWITQGGNPIYAAMTLASWHGAADETATGAAYENISSTGTLDNSLAYMDVLHLENALFMDAATAEDRAAVKQAILDYGGAVLCLYYAASYLSDANTLEPTPTPVPTATPEPTTVPTTTPETVTEVETSVTAEDVEETDEPTTTPESAATPEPTATPTPELCYYQDSYTDTNHEVLLVGWDDEYPAENFAHSSNGAIPPEDGAWLCRNSYGDNWQGSDGYFWISYYDSSVSYDSGGTMSARITFFDFAGADNFDNVYQYDGAVVSALVTGTVDGSGVSVNNAAADREVRYANVFTAGADTGGSLERIAAISTYTSRAGVPYKAYIYTNLTDPTVPDSGTLAATLSGTFTYPGYHTLYLEEDVTVLTGETFSVVFAVQRAEDATRYVPACITSSSWRSVNENPGGQSFVSTNGTDWTDCVTLTNSPNVRVKAFTDTVPLSVRFDDVQTDQWYFPYVYRCTERGLIQGVTASRFYPNVAATRAEVVTTLYRLAGEPETSGVTAFDDVPAGAWYFQAICWAEENGIAQGSDDDGNGIYSFIPQTAVTREEFAVFLHRCAALINLDGGDTDALSSFTDSADISDWALEAEAWTVETGLQQGIPVSEGVALCPRDSISRAEMTAFLTRFADLGF